MTLNRFGFMLVQRQNKLNLEIYGRQLSATPCFTSFHRSSAGIAVVLGRLFYRQDLLDRLGLTFAPGARPGSGCEDGPDLNNNASLILAAYERWGHDAFARLEGDFAVAIYDTRDHRLLAFRDTLGGYPLYFVSSPGVTAISTCIGPLTQFLSCIEINRDSLADYLLLRTFGLQQPDSDGSIINGIDRVRTGQVVHLYPESGRVERRQYWDWVGTVAATAIPETNPEEVHGRFGALLSAAVHERCTDATAVQLSGGMDSTAVALLAADPQPGKAPVHAISLIYEKWQSLTGETAYVREALQACPSLVPHSVLADEIHDFNCFPAPPPTDEPWPGLYRVAAEASMYAVAAAAGATSMLTGAGGDEVADPLPFDVADQLLRGQLWAAWSTAKRWGTAQGKNVWNVLRPYGLKPLTPAPLRGGLGTFLRHGRARWRDLDDRWIAPWIRPDFARRYNMYDRVIAEYRRTRSFDPSLQVSESLYMITARNGDMIRWYIGAPRAIHTGNPFLDPRVFRYGLAVRSRLPFQGNRQKPLLADALRGKLPDAIRNRRRKSNFSETFFLGLSRKANHLETMIQSASLDDLGIVDKQVLLRCFSEYRMARASDSPASGRMTTILGVLNWLCHYNEWIHVRQPASQTLQFSTSHRN